MNKAAGIAVVITVAALVGATLVVESGAASKNSTASASCATHLKRDNGLRVSLRLNGHPAWFVRGACAAVAKYVPGWKPGAISGTPKLVCAARTRAYPGVRAGIFTSPLVARLARPLCPVIFKSRDWVRLR
jgi:hypothetical protein